MSAQFAIIRYFIVGTDAMLFEVIEFCFWREKNALFAFNNLKSKYNDRNHNSTHIKSEITVIETVEIDECLHKTYLLNALPKTHILYRI